MEIIMTLLHFCFWNGKHLGIAFHMRTVFQTMFTLEWKSVAQMGILLCDFSSALALSMSELLTFLVSVCFRTMVNTFCLTGTGRGFQSLTDIPVTNLKLTSVFFMQAGFQRRWKVKPIPSAPRERDASHCSVKHLSLHGCICVLEETVHSIGDTGY